MGSSNELLFYITVLIRQKVKKKKHLKSVIWYSRFQYLQAFARHNLISKSDKGANVMLRGSRLANANGQEKKNYMDNT